MTRRAIYNPCDIGLHVCGEYLDAADTVANFPCQTASDARRLFEIARSELAVDGDDWDVIVDLNVGADEHHIDDFGMRRQMLPRLAALASNL